MMVFGSRSLPAGEKQPLSDERVAGEILAGGIGNAIGLLVVRVVVTSHQWDADDETRVIIFFGLGSVAALLGSSYSVHLVGIMGDETGSLGATLLVGLVGGGLGLAGGYGFAALDINKMT